MKSIIAFRPGLIATRTTFKVQTLIYKYIQDHYNYNFTIVKSEDENYSDSAFEVISIPKKTWKGSLDKLKLPKFYEINRSYLDSIFAQADGILTVDPTIYPQGILAIKTAHQMEKPVWFDASLTIRAFSENLTWKLRRRFFLRKAMENTTGIIVTVPKCIERFKDLGLFDNVTAPKFKIMGHPVDTIKNTHTPKRSTNDGILRVLVISRMVPEKGLFYILEAMTPLLRSRGNLQFQFLGSGPMRSFLEIEVAERELGEKVIFINPVPHSEIYNILAGVDIFVNHAVSIGCWEEYFGIANLEAMSCGLPCVLTNCGGISYTIREKNVAVFVEQRNIVQLREAIGYLIDSEQERQEMGKKARDYVERYYALPIIADKYHQMLQCGFSNSGG